MNGLKGVDVVVSTVGGPALHDQLLVIEAAKEAGVKRFYPSEFGGDPRTESHVILEKSVTCFAE